MGKEFASLKTSLGTDFDLSQGLNSGSLNVTSAQFYGPDGSSTGVVSSLADLNKLSTSVTKYTIINIEDTEVQVEEPEPGIISTFPSICTTYTTRGTLYKNSAGVEGLYQFWHDSEWMNPYFIGIMVNPANGSEIERYFFDRNGPRYTYYVRETNTLHNANGYSSHSSVVMWDATKPAPILSTSNPPNIASYISISLIPS